MATSLERDRQRSTRSRPLSGDPTSARRAGAVSAGRCDRRDRCRVCRVIGALNAVTGAVTAVIGVVSS